MKSRNGMASINNNESKTIGKMNVNREMNNEKSIDGLTKKGMRNDCWQNDEHDGCNKKIET